MPCILPEHKLSYIPVPKIACTSLKNLFYQIENGRRFETYQINGRIRDIHKLYPSMPFKDLNRTPMADHQRLAVVRDPLSRVLSCYRNRVAEKGALSEARVGPALAERNLKPDPSLSEFIGAFKRYQRVSPEVMHHSSPLSVFLGTDPSYYTKIYALSNIGEFVAHVSETVGQQLELEHLQTGGPKLSVEADMTEQERAKIRRIFAEDYQIFGEYF